MTPIEWECPSCETDTEGTNCHYCGYGEQDMSNGREHSERRAAQAAAARKPENLRRTLNRPGKGNRNNWKQESNG